MRIIVSDSDCLIDFRKASLLEAFLALPFEIVTPNTLFEDELVKFTEAQKRTLRRGIRLADLPGPLVLRAQQVIREVPQLSIHDGFAFALAEATTDCILLTGDRPLRALAVRHEIEVHGVLWVVDQIHANQPRSAEMLYQALRVLSGDAAVRLPRRQLDSYLKKYDALR